MLTLARRIWFTYYLLRRPVGIILENHLMGVSKAKNKTKNSQKLGITAS